MDTAKAVLRRTFIALSKCLHLKKKKSLKNLTLYFKELEKEEQTKPQVAEEVNNKD